MQVRLVPIDRSPEHGALAISWALDLWADHIPDYSREDWDAFYQNALHADYQTWSGPEQELVYVGMRGDEVVGTIALVGFDDLDEFRDLTPWVAAFVVNPKLRGQGIGTHMLNLIEQQAQGFGFDHVHLWTEDQTSFYLQRGYVLHATRKWQHLSFDVLRKDLLRNKRIDDLLGRTS